MGYCMYVVDSNFNIKKKNNKKALAAIKALAGKETITDSSGKHFSWVNTEDFLSATNLYDAIDAWGWELEEDERGGNIVGISFMREKIGDEDALFNAIAPYVEKNSFIEMQGEDGARWRWFFDGEKCLSQEAKITWE